MAEIVKDRVCAEVEGDITVFLIGMRINKLWKVWSWLPVFFAMPRMLEELGANPEIGLLGTRTTFGLRNQMLLQYWKSAEHLRTYAHSQQHTHLPAWRRFNERIGSNGDVGIWHETYVVPHGSSESIFVNMPKFGLGLVGTLFPAKGQRASASKRLERVEAAAVSEPAPLS